MRALFACTLLAALTLPLAASAYVPSQQNGAFELKFGPYTPNVDEEPGLKKSGSKPYHDTLGNDWMFLTVLELDWQIVHMWGMSLGVGGSAGFMQTYAKAKTPEGVPSSDYTVLNVIPFAILAVLRVDALADELNIPFVPYFKAGINWYLWWVLAGGDTVDKGATPGWQLSPGLMFRLDSFDPMSARTFDNEVGVNHSYIFGEFTWATVEGFGQGGFMYLSDTTFLIGLALEF
ncbi:MAG: MXAN_2562 family outer membrane beta-barrel protein [Deltaproteobacteria bacterium]|nr:MXAN_2562 family outer membrane beta-barrel protein [Deltaproteobacteria bacterium]